MLQVLKSQIDALPFDYREAVRQHAIALEKHRFSTGSPMPVAHPLVEAAIVRVRSPGPPEKPDDIRAEYQIVDDTPPPPPDPTLEQKKAGLYQAIQQAETAAIMAVEPPGRARLIELDAQEAFAKREEDRTEADNDAIDVFMRYQDDVKAIRRRAANAMAEVDALTAETVDAWQVGDV